MLLWAAGVSGQHACHGVRECLRSLLRNVVSNPRQEPVPIGPREVVAVFCRDRASDPVRTAFEHDRGNGDGRFLRDEVLERLVAGVAVDESVTSRVDARSCSSGAGRWWLTGSEVIPNMR